MAEDVLAAPVTLRAPRWVRALRRVLETDGLAVTVGAVWLAAVAVQMPRFFVTDSWLSLVDGRYVAAHGLPHHDTLTYWTVGERWIDQQWGAHLALYGAWRVGGLTAVALLALGCVAAALVVAGIAARRLGASPRSALFAVALPLSAAPWMAQIRSQVLVLPLFVAAYALLAADARRPGRRVLWVLPLLVLWANLHGSVALAAGLACLYGVWLALGGRRAVGLALAAAPLTLLASPYGFDLVGYYRLMLLSPPFAKVVEEWKPMPVELFTILFFVSAFGAVALLARARTAITGFEQLALLALLAAGLDARRNSVWFELAFALALPRLLDAVWKSSEAAPGVRRSNLALALVAAPLACLAVATHVGLGLTDAGGAPAAAAAVSNAAGTQGVVLADDNHADWLLWERPELAGRVAYDVRFELYDGAQLSTILALHDAYLPAWKRCGRTFAVVAYGDATGKKLLPAGVLAAGARRLVGGASLGAYTQPAPAPACRL